MKVIINIIISLFMVGTVTNASAQCGPTKVEPSPYGVGFCEGTPSDTISFTTTGTCAENWEYQIITLSNDVIQSWSNIDEYVNTEPVSETYIVKVRCPSCPSSVVLDTFYIEAISKPTITSDTFICHGTSIDLTASGGAAGTMSWWDSPTNGRRLSSTESYTTPPMTSDDTFYVRLSGTVTGGTSEGSILITECGLEGFPGNPSADYIEVSNLFSTSVNTEGWVVAVSNSYSDINRVNTIFWELPSSFDPCSMLYRSDVRTEDYYWGNNILWAAGQPGWAAIVDDLGGLVDFIAWGWNEAQLANFNATINGFNITLGDEWTGDGCNSACRKVSGVPYSFSRTGNSDNNNADDFICQASSIDLLNPGLDCGWVASDFSCPYPMSITVDLPPTASVPDTAKLVCYADIPAPDISIITDVMDDHTPNPTVEYVGETSNGKTCPEILIHTYRVTDSCSNYIELEHVIVIHDTVPPIVEPAPADLSLQCLSDIPPMVSLNWTDNCLGSGVVIGEEVSDGKSCPETITRTWTVADDCGNTSKKNQVIIINDDTPPTASNLPSLQLAVLPPADPSLITDAADNCGTPQVEWVEDISDNGFCPENIIRTYSVADDCGNVTYVTQNFIIGDDTPNVSFTANPALLDNFSDGIVYFKNQTTGATSYIWDFGDDSEKSNEPHPSHKYDISSSRQYEVWLTATSEYDCKDSTNFIIEVFHELVYFVPNAFTPNGDDFNQTFQPVFAAGFDPNEYNFSIYNRWGQILFESYNHEIGWDGTYEGDVVPDGTYVYKIEFGLENSREKKTITGHFSLLR